MKAEMLITQTNKFIMRLFFIILLSVFSLSNLTAQKNSPKITITGTVLDVYKNPVVNAIVIVDGQKTNSITDSKGKYKVRIKSDAAKIGVVAFGNGIIEEEIRGRTTIYFEFSTQSFYRQPDQGISPGEAGVNVGYNYVKKKDLTTQVDYIDGKDKKYASYRSIEEMIQREVSGVQILGGAVVIHGSRNFFGWVGAMIIIDGVPAADFANLTPSMVESIVVLKDASAAIYGTRGYGGVILITTRKENN